MKKQRSALVFCMLLVLACSNTVVPVVTVLPVVTLTPTLDPTVDPLPTHIDVTDTPTLTPSPTEAPTQTATLALTQTPSVAPTETKKPTATPTATPTPSIWEATPLSGTQQNITADYWQGFPSDTMYTTWQLMNVRSCPSTDCEIVDRYAAGKTVEVFAKYHIFMSSDKWLCLEYLEQVDKETQCRKAIAYNYRGQQRGEIVWP